MYPRSPCHPISCSAPTSTFTWLWQALRGKNMYLDKASQLLSYVISLMMLNTTPLDSCQTTLHSWSARVKAVAAWLLWDWTPHLSSRHSSAPAFCGGSYDNHKKQEEVTSWVIGKDRIRCGKKKCREFQGNEYRRVFWDCTIQTRVLPGRDHAENMPLWSPSLQPCGKGTLSTSSEGPQR